MSRIVFIDTEVTIETKKVCDYGAVKSPAEDLHTRSETKFAEFISGSEYICGHNILAHDFQFISGIFHNSGAKAAIDTLYLSPLLFPRRPYHSLLKDDKLSTDELNNPLNDSKKAMLLFNDELNAFEKLSDDIKDIFCGLLYDKDEFSGFFKYIDRKPPSGDISPLIRNSFKDKICANCDIDVMIENNPTELAYCLALINSGDRYSIIPHWVHRNFPSVENIMRLLRSTPCKEDCGYCNKELDIHRRLKSIFGYDNFREYNGEPLQEKAVHAAVKNESLLAIFPTGGGKSITFQLPALIAGEASKGLTVVISPLQSLMKDQVDNLEKKGIADAVTINGLLSPVERSEAIERVESGLASILYISPESLRSRTIERLFLARNISRFVIDEAHCFSAWGQDFRVDYLYIGDFIKELQEKKHLDYKIPVSCFTATAKQKVISDIKDYFKRKLDIDLDVYATNAALTNLRYEVLYKETDDEKYAALRSLIELKNCPTIVYVSRTRRTREIAEKLCSDGFKARPFNGKMDSTEKQKNQEAFINDEVQIIVATSAFGMGVDKSNVGLVIHYDISDSLENYVQEAGRAGRDSSMQAECYVLFNDGDLDKHFILLNQTKLSISEIQQVWKAIKDLTKTRPSLCRSALEIARQAGWDDSVSDIETRVKTAVLALENAGYIKRGKNIPQVFATSILVPNMADASAIIESSFRLKDNEKTLARRIISSLISSRSIAKAGNDDAESRVDYISDKLGAEKADVIRCIELMREDGILADSKDLTAYIRRADTKNKSLAILNKYIALENFLLENLSAEGQSIYFKELNEKALASGIKSSTVNAIKTVFYYWTIKSYIEKSIDAAANRVNIVPEIDPETLKIHRGKCVNIAKFIVSYLYDRSLEEQSDKEDILVLFSVLELKNAYENSRMTEITCNDIEDALLYLAKIDSMKLEGGFLVLYSGMSITRLELDNKIKYKKDDYKQLDEFYKQKIQQIHIVGEYANMMVRDYNAALEFVNDYFQKDYKVFLNKYFAGDRAIEIERNITPAKHNALFGNLSEMQKAIIEDKSQYIVVAAGPGSGKTRVLVHKLASLMQLEDAKHEQLLMVTFSRAAATEFKVRLRELMGNAASFIEIKTFHSYCFDLLGKIGSLENAENIVADAAQMIRNGDVELGRITKTVIVIDEAQDMDENEFELIEALMDRNEEMRVIAVGDDDQNIYQFRGSDSKYLRSFITEKGAVKYELLENYRSGKNIVAFANAFAETITERMKTAPIIPVKEENGEVKLIRYNIGHIEEAVVNDVMNTYDGSGTACVLTSTNMEAVNVAGLLNKRGQKAKLVQVNDSFDIYNIAEIRYFMKRIESELHSAVIDDELWTSAKRELSEVYADSECLQVILDLLEDFEKTSEKKYKSDLDMFLHESKLENFYRADNGTVFVSTIHKSKGCEFDSVYMLLDNARTNTDEERRKIYVGMTRAKSKLHIHYNNDIFNGFEETCAEKIYDNARYSAPQEIIIQLTHRDVNLGFFKDKKKLILNSLRSGMALGLTNSGMCVLMNGKPYEVLRFSKKFCEEIEKIKRSGYMPYMGKIRFIVAWKDEDDTESAVILPDIYFRA